MRDVVDVVTSDPPPLRYGVDDIVASGERAQRRRRLGRAVAGAASVVVGLGVAAAVVVPSFTSGGTGTSAPNSVGAPAAAPAGPVGPFTFTFGTYTVGRLTVAAPIDVSTAYELAPVYAEGLTSNDKPADPSTEIPGRDKGAPGYRPDPAKDLYAYLTVYRPGAYDPTKLAGAQPVTIGGRPGLEVTDTTGNWPMTRTLAWQHADNAWAVLSVRSDDTTYPSADDLRRLAAGLRTEARTPAKVPVKLGYVPAGYGLTEVGVHATTGLNGISSARAGDHAGLLYSKPAQPTTGLTGPFENPDGGNPTGSFAIFVVPSANSNQPTSSPGVSCLTGFCNRYFDNGKVLVQVSSEGLLPDSEMRRILEGVTLTNVQDESTWVSPVS
ncbi:hypothetical protein [Virgisporangium aurantiacum]|nr:hypothetical protein [Virgisporangium aurantiacum]